MREDSFNPHLAWAACVEDDTKDGGVNFIFSGTWFSNTAPEEFALHFPSVEDLGTWLDGPAARAVQAYRTKKENTPVRVIERALEGTYRDNEAQAEMIVEDLREAGYEVVFAAPEPQENLPEKTNWRHPRTDRSWPLDQWDMRDGLGDVWHWAGGFENDGTGVFWPILSRNDWAVTDLRWDTVEVNGIIRPVTKTS